MSNLQSNLFIGSVIYFQSAAVASGLPLTNTIGEEESSSLEFFRYSVGRVRYVAYGLPSREGKGRLKASLVMLVSKIGRYNIVRRMLCFSQFANSPLMKTQRRKE